MSSAQIVTKLPSNKPADLKSSNSSSQKKSRMDCSFAGMIKAARYCYLNSPLNFSFLTGLRYPHLPHLRGTGLLGLAFGAGPDFAKQGPDGTVAGLMKLSQMADQSQFGMGYYFADHTHCHVIIVDQNNVRQFFQFINERKLDRSLVVETNFGQGFGPDTIFTLPSHHANKTRHDGYFRQRGLFQNALQTNLGVTTENIGKVVDIFLEKLDAKIADEKCEFDLEELTTAMTLTISGKTLYGVPMQKDFSYEDVKKITSACEHLVDQIFDYRNYVNTKLYGKSKTTEAKDHLSEVTKELFIEPFGKDIAGSENLLSTLAAALDTKVDHPQMLDNINFALLAGHDTTARLLQFLIMYLDANPAVLHNVETEIMDCKLEQNGQYSQDQIKEMPWLNACINEILRLHPPAPIIGYGVKESVTFETEDKDASYAVKLKTGDAVILDINRIHRSERNFENANEFNPKRFLNEKPSPHAFLPFGIGTRMCPSFKFSPLEVGIAFAKIIQKYQIQTNAKQPFEVRSVGTTRYKDKVTITLKPRHKLGLNLTRKL